MGTKNKIYLAAKAVETNYVKLTKTYHAEREYMQKISPMFRLEASLEKHT